MNERIKELWEEATVSTWPSPGKFTAGEYDYHLKKFAELIVQECMSQIEEVRQIKAGNAGPVYTQGFEDGMFVAIRTIEEHFGVQE